MEAVLDATRSPYLAPFQKLEAAIEHGVALATDNVKYLGILEAPSTALAKCLPKVSTQPACPPSAVVWNMLDRHTACVHVLQSTCFTVSSCLFG